MPAKLPSEPSLRIGALFVLSIGFVLSAMLRAGEVVAALPTGADDGFGNPVAARVQETQQDTQEGEAPIQGPTEIVAELQRMQQSLADRERGVEAREQRLNILQRHLEQRLEELRKAREDLASTVSLVDDAAGKDVRRLADMFQQMKPKQAGEIFNQMAPSFAAGFIAEMRSDAAALVMANMEAEKAYAVSLLIAGRNIQTTPAPNDTPVQNNLPAPSE